jgi:hypothetical protein
MGRKKANPNRVRHAARERQDTLLWGSPTGAAGIQPIQTVGKQLQPDRQRSGRHGHRGGELFHAIGTPVFPENIPRGSAELKAGTPERIADNSEGDSDKSLVITTGERGFELLSVYIKLDSAVSVGNRHVCLTVRDQAGNDVMYVEQPHDQAALSTHYYLFGVGLTNDSSISTYEFIGIPPIVIPNGYTVRVFDAAAIAASSDDLRVEIMGRHL